MATTEVETHPHLTALSLPSVPEAVPIARRHVRATLVLHGLSEFADDAEIIASELVTNAACHARGDGTEAIGLSLVYEWNPERVTVVVTDASIQGPVQGKLPDGDEHGRGLVIVDRLSTRWGWYLDDRRKTVYAVLVKDIDAGRDWRLTAIPRTRRAISHPDSPEACEMDA